MAGEQVPSRPYVKQYEKDFLSENAQNSPKKRKNTQKRSVCLRSFFVCLNGEPTVNYPNTTTLIINGFAFIMRIDVAKTK